MLSISRMQEVLRTPISGEQRAELYEVLCTVDLVKLATDYNAVYSEVAVVFYANDTTLLISNVLDMPPEKYSRCSSKRPLVVTQ